MPIKFWFWLLMVLWLISRFWFDWRGRPAGQSYPYNLLPGHLLMFLLFSILGWKAFGAPWDALVN